MKVTAILKGMIDSNGHQPIQLRLSHKGKQSFRPTGIKVLPALFKNGRVDSKHPKAKEYNQKIETRIIQLQAESLQGVSGKVRRVNFFDFIDALIPTLERSPGTLKAYKSQRKKLMEFAPSFYLDEVTHDFLNKYKVWLKDKGLDNNTIWNAQKFLNTFLDVAVSDKLLPANPIKSWKGKVMYKESSRTYLSDKEVGKLEQFLKKKLPQEVRDATLCFLIGCFSGLRISDLQSFDKKKHIQGGRLVMQTIKTGEVVGIPVKGRLKKYLEMAGYKPLKAHPNTYNKLLKVIAAATGIDKHLTAHISRHTTAMLLANAGVSMEVTGKILGQKSPKTTAIYYKISNKRIDNEITGIL
jgi:site-specific recombinase XerD